MLYKTLTTGAIYLLLFLCYTESFADWNCLSDIHKSALSDALKSSPTEFKNNFAQQENKMLSEVGIIHRKTKSEWFKFNDLYKTIVTNIKKNDPKKLDTTVRFLTYSTMYIFQKNVPITVPAYCDQKEILKKAYVIYDGYDKNSTYTSFTNTDFEVPFQYPNVKPDEMLIFYNKLVNEIINLWSSAWNDAGKDMTGLPKASSSIKGNTKNIAKKPDIQQLSLPAAIKQDDAPTMYSDADLSKYRGTSDFKGVQTFDSRGALSPQRSKNSTDNSSKQASVQCPKCDEMMAKAQKMISTKGTKVAAINAMTDLANTCYTSCRGTELPMRSEVAREATSENNRSSISTSPGTMVNPGAINITTGEFYPGAAGGINNPRTGQFYPDVGGGYINPKNGQFMPKQ